MAHEWIIDVLQDLRDFAGQNGLVVTERQIEKSLAVVTEEVASIAGLAQGAAQVGHVGEFSGEVGESQNT